MSRKSTLLSFAVSLSTLLPAFAEHLGCYSQATASACGIAGCDWFGSKNICFEKGCNATLCGIFDGYQMQCNAQQECIWVTTGSVCNFIYTDQSDCDDDEKGMRGATIAAIVVPLVLILLAICIYVIYHQRQQLAKKENYVVPVADEAAMAEVKKDADNKVQQANQELARMKKSHDAEFEQLNKRNAEALAAAKAAQETLEQEQKHGSELADEISKLKTAQEAGNLNASQYEEQVKALQDAHAEKEKDLADARAALNQHAAEKTKLEGEVNKLKKNLEDGTLNMDDYKSRVKDVQAKHDVATAQAQAAHNEAQERAKARLAARLKKTAPAALEEGVVGFE